jgi:hypothetical protein
MYSKYVLRGKQGSFVGELGAGTLWFWPREYSFGVLVCQENLSHGIRHSFLARSYAGEVVSVLQEFHAWKGLGLQGVTAYFTDALTVAIGALSA